MSEELNNIIDKFFEDVYALRKASLEKDGEYGIGNLVFKELRSKGYLDKLKDLKNATVSKELSLENLNEEAKSDEELFWDREALANKFKDIYNYNNLYLDEEGKIQPIPNELVANKFSVSCEQAGKGDLKSREELEQFKKDYNGEYIVFFLADGDDWGNEYSIIVKNEEDAKRATKDYNQDGYGIFDTNGEYVGAKDLNGNLI